MNHIEWLGSCHHDSSVASEVAKYALPPEKGDVKLIDADNIDELITLLKNEAKAI